MTAPLAQFGSYALGQSIADHPEAKEYSWLERSVAMNHAPGETLYNVPGRVEAIGTSWSLVLGVYQGRIYKLSLRWGSPDDKPMTAKLYEVVDYCRAQFGSNGNDCNDDASIWTTDFGAVAVIGRFIDHTYCSEGRCLVMVESVVPMYGPPQAAE